MDISKDAFQENMDEPRNKLWSNPTQRAMMSLSFALLCLGTLGHTIISDSSTNFIIKSSSSKSFYQAFEFRDYISWCSDFSILVENKN